MLGGIKNMNIIKKIFIAMTMLFSGSIAFGYDSWEVEEVDFVLIDNFRQELLVLDTQEAQGLAIYLEKVLKNEDRFEAYCIPKNDVLAIDSVLKSDIFFDEKQNKIIPIQAKFELRRQRIKIFENIQVGVTLVICIGYVVFAIDQIVRGKHRYW